MIDLERELVAALRDHADTITPSAPPSFDRLVAPVLDVMPEYSPRRGWWVAAAVVVVLGVVAGLVVLRDRGDDVKPTDTTISERGTWQKLPEAPLSPRKTPSVVWTGTEFIVWGGSDGAPHGLSDGAAYDPATGRWRTIAPAPTAHPGANAVWVGDRMVVLAGMGGQAYDPVVDTWSALPELEPGPLTKGFTDAVSTNGQLLGVGVDMSDSGQSAVLTAWRLDTIADRWVELSQITAPTALPVGRFVSAADQFSVYDPIATDDGFVLWSGWEGGWRFALDEGWSRVPRIPKPDGGRYNGTAALWDGGRLSAVVSLGTATTGSYGLMSLDDTGWSALSVRGQRDLVMPRAIAVDRGIVVLDPFLSAPVVVVGATPAVELTSSPLDTVIDQGAAWSGEQLLIWGGQRSTGEGEQTTDDPGPISSDGALWTSGN